MTKKKLERILAVLEAKRDCSGDMYEHYKSEGDEKFASKYLAEWGAYLDAIMLLTDTKILNDLEKIWINGDLS